MADGNAESHTSTSRLRSCQKFQSGIYKQNQWQHREIQDDVQEKRKTQRAETVDSRNRKSCESRQR